MLASFSVPKPLGDHVKQLQSGYTHYRDFVLVVTWLLQKDLIVQLHTHPFFFFFDNKRTSFGLKFSKCFCWFCSFHETFQGRKAVDLRVNGCRGWRGWEWWRGGRGRRVGTKEEESVVGSQGEERVGMRVLQGEWHCHPVVESNAHARISSRYSSKDVSQLACQSVIYGYVKGKQINKPT